MFSDDVTFVLPFKHSLIAFATIHTRMVSASTLINSDNIKRLIYIGLAAFFVTRVYSSGTKLAAQEVGYSQKIITEDPQMYPSFTMCALYVPFYGAEGLTSMSSNLTEKFLANKDFMDHILELKHSYQEEESR